MMEPRFTFSIDYDGLMVGLKHIIYRDRRSGHVLGGWDVVGKEDHEIVQIIKKNQAELEKRLYANWS